MKNVVFLELRCEKNKNPFYARYDLAADNLWVKTYGVKTLPQGEFASQAGSDLGSFAHGRTGPQYGCPWCGARDYVKCGSCQNLTCYNSESGFFNCAHCGNSGKVTGTISADDFKKMRKSSGNGQ